MTADPNPALSEYRSPWSFDQTLERLVRAIESRDMRIFATVDHAANAREVGLAMPAATVLIYGAARGGTPVMISTPLAALDLPLRVLVRVGQEGDVMIAFHPIAELLGRVGVPQPMAARLAPAQQMLVEALAP